MIGVHVCEQDGVDPGRIDAGHREVGEQMAG